MKVQFNGINYFNAITAESVIEKETLDMSKPFGLFSGAINIGLTERLNILERETVKIYMKRLNTMQGIMD